MTRSSAPWTTDRGFRLALAGACVLLASALPATGLGAGADADALRSLARAAGAGRLVDAPPSVPPPEAASVVLGRDLFFSRDLGVDGDVACASCHHPLLGGADGLALPIGVGARDPAVVGPGRMFDWRASEGLDPHAVAGPNVARNSPTVFNVGLYSRTLFHDGRVRFLPELGVFRSPESSRDSGRDLLSVQARLPLAAENEMRGYRAHRHAPSQVVRDAIIARLRAPGSPWPAAFARTFGDAGPGAASVTQRRLEHALSDYQRSLMFIDSPWMRFLAGDDNALSATARAGATDFFTAARDGGAGCVRCHSGDHFTDEAFHVLATPQLGRGIERPAGRFGTATRVDGSDLGRGEVTGRRADSHAFRTPALTNAALTAPYGHAGAFDSLAAIIRHHLDPAASIERYDFDGAVAALGVPGAARRARVATLAALESWRRSGGEPRLIEEDRIAALVAFVEALTDDCAARPACLARWLPADGGGFIVVALGQRRP